VPELALTEQERAELADILAEEVESAKLRTFVEGWFGEPFDLIAPGASAVTAPRAFLDWIVLKGHTRTLVTHLLRDVPKTPKLMIFLARLGGTPGDSPLQALLNFQGPMQDWVVFGAHMQRRGHQICRIEIGGKPIGTGVLVSQDRVLTAFHVIASCVQQAGNRWQAKEDSTYQISIRRVERMTGLRFGQLSKYDGFSNEEVAVGSDISVPLGDWRSIRI
jgi:hypothetical protein